MAQRTSDRMTPAERALRVLSYLQRNTDEAHPITQAELKRDPLLKRCLGAKETSNDLLNGIARALNCDEDDTVLPEDDWRIVFDAFRECYSSAPREEDETGSDEDAPAHRMPIRNLYYQPVFSYEEIDCLIEGVRFSKLLDERAAERIVDKIKRNLASKYYAREHKGIRKVREPALLDRAQMHESLTAIQTAIDADRQIVFRFNAYDRSKALRPVGAPHTVSPYYIVASGGRYYLIGCPDYAGKMYIWRIDLMTDVKQAEQRRVPRREVAGLPLEWTDDFQLSHLNMSYDEPVTIRLRVREDDGGVPPCTFLHDWFGDTFRCVGTDEVEVLCSPFGMVNWAMQYSGRVEVLAPESVREAVRERVRKMCGKYGVGGK